MIKSFEDIFGGWDDELTNPFWNVRTTTKDGNKIFNDLLEEYRNELEKEKKKKENEYGLIQRKDSPKTLTWDDAFERLKYREISAQIRDTTECRSMWADGKNTKMSYYKYVYTKGGKNCKVAVKDSITNNEVCVFQLVGKMDDFDIVVNSGNIIMFSNDALYAYNIATRKIGYLCVESIDDVNYLDKGYFIYRRMDDKQICCAKLFPFQYGGEGVESFGENLQNAVMSSFTDKANDDYDFGFLVTIGDRGDDNRRKFFVEEKNSNLIYRDWKKKETKSSGQEQPNLIMSLSDNSDHALLSAKAVDDRLAKECNRRIVDKVKKDLADLAKRDCSVKRDNIWDEYCKSLKNKVSNDVVKTTLPEDFCDSVKKVGNHECVKNHMPIKEDENPKIKNDDDIDADKVGDTIGHILSIIGDKNSRFVEKLWREQKVDNLIEKKNPKEDAMDTLLAMVQQMWRDFYGEPYSDEELN